jgi:valyl-tRNA synthetase
MRGKDVLWQPGTDHAGIATQMVVERQLMERQQPGRREMGRENFLRRVWEWKAESGGTIIRQLKRLGASCDWSRERFTMDEGLSRAVIKVFVELYNEGLIYKDKRLVNWDPKLLTAISDLEVQQVEVRGSLWHIRYPLEGKTFDANDPSTFITVATTRPETMLGDTAVAVHPEDERYKHLIGTHVILPLVGRRIPIVGDEISDPEKGSGAVKITPAHDFVDFDVGKRHGLRQVSILTIEAKLDLRDNSAFLEGVPPSSTLDETIALDGMDRFAARKRVVERLEAAGLIDKIEPNTHVVPHGDRSNVVIEPFLTDQWYVNAKAMAVQAIAAVEEGRTTFIPKNWEKTYFEWMENIQPWCISRQLWWGHQIPAWYGPDGRVFVAETEDEAVSRALAYYTETGAINEAQARDMARHPEKRTPFLTRDEDVLDTWFSSALWPFSTLGWPDKTPELARFYPTSTLVTGFDIIFFWVARMMMMGLHFMKEVPFRDVYIHRLVRDEKGAKMSKSKGNVVDPLGIIDDYGADALRFTLARGAAQGHDIRLSPQTVENNRNFATKLWNAARFVEFNGAARVAGFDPRNAKETLNRWIAHETAKAAREITEALEQHRFNDAANEAYRFVWNVYCDWYVELSKPLLTGPDGAAKDETRATAAWALDEILRLLHPFMPFITEELWRVTGEQGPKRDRLLVLSDWPKHVGLDDAKAEAEIGWVVDLVTAVRSVRAEMNITPQIPLVLAGASAETKARAERWKEFMQRLARVADIDVADAPPPGSVQLLVRGEIVAMPLKGVIDFAAEQARLNREMSKVEADIKRLDAKLGNADFLARAPEELVEGEREKRDEAEDRRAKIVEALERLKGAA